MLLIKWVRLWEPPHENPDLKQTFRETSGNNCIINNILYAFYNPTMQHRRFIILQYPSHNTVTSRDWWQEQMQHLLFTCQFSKRHLPVQQGQRPCECWRKDHNSDTVVQDLHSAKLSLHTANTWSSVNPASVNITGLKATAAQQMKA